MIANGESFVRTFVLLTTSNITMVNTTVNGFFTTSDGGVIQSSNSNANIYNSTFINNTADVGGAIYLSCDNDQTCSYNIDNCTFIGNIAYTQGAGIYYDYFAPVMNLSTMTFINNTAPYGATIAAYAYSLEITNLNSVE